MSANPLIDGDITIGRDPFDSNQAIPTLLATKYRDDVTKAVPGLALASVDWFSFFAYPLTGGFKPWSALPLSLAGTLLALEWKVRHIFGRLAAFRMLVVYEKRRTET